MAVIVGILGWIGAVAVLGGYLLFSAGRIANGPLYQVLNLVGSVCICINVFAHGAWPSTIVNGIWALIAAVVLGQWARRRRAARASRPAAVLEARPEPPTTTRVLPVVGPASTGAVPIADAVPVITATIAVVVANAVRDRRSALEPEGPEGAVER